MRAVHTGVVRCERARQVRVGDLHAGMTLVRIEHSRVGQSRKRVRFQQKTNFQQQNSEVCKVKLARAGPDSSPKCPKRTRSNAVSSPAPIGRGAWVATRGSRSLAAERNAFWWATRFLLCTRFAGSTGRRPGFAMDLRQALKPGAAGFARNEPRPNPSAVVNMWEQEFNTLMKPPMFHSVLPERADLNAQSEPPFPTTVLSKTALMLIYLSD